MQPPPPLPRRPEAPGSAARTVQRPAAATQPAPPGMSQQLASEDGGGGDSDIDSPVEFSNAAGGSSRQRGTRSATSEGQTSGWVGWLHTPAGLARLCTAPRRSTPADVAAAAATPAAVGVRPPPAETPAAASTPGAHVPLPAGDSGHSCKVGSAGAWPPRWAVAGCPRLSAPAPHQARLLQQLALSPPPPPPKKPSSTLHELLRTRRVTPRRMTRGG